MVDPLTLPCQIDLMTVADIDAVVKLDQLAYGSAFPHRNYRYELEKNEFSHYFVLRPAGDVSTLPLLRSIYGVAGFWLIVDEIHIISLVIHPSWQGLGLGQWLLLHLLEQGQAAGGQVATLEVRPSNQVAISLYRKYGFRKVGRRVRYYSDGEDALIFTTPALDLSNYQTTLTRQKWHLRQRLAEIQIDKLT